jgi:hypothetical protein
MAWSPPYDADGKLVGAAQTVTVGTGMGAHTIRVTSVDPAIDQTILRNSDSGNWDSTKRRLFPSKIVIASDTKLSIKGNFFMSETPDWVLDLLFSGGTTPLSWKPDGTNELLGGDWIVGNFSGTFPAEDYCTFSVDVEVSGAPDIGGNISVPS